MRNGGLPEGAEIQHIYLGLPFGDGSLSNEYSDAVHGIYEYADAVIFFSSRLATDLHEHGQTLREPYRKHFSDPPPSLAKGDFTDARDAGLFPDEAKYDNWLGAFQQAQLKKRWWQRGI